MAKKQIIDWAGDTIKIAYGNGAKFEADCTKYPPSIYVPCAAARHGIAQKFGDAKSGGTAAEKFAEVQLIHASLLGGDWNRKGEGGSVEMLMPEVWKVLAGGDDKKAAAWQAKWDALTDEGKETILAKPDVKTALVKVKAERKLAGLESDEADPFTM